MAISSASRKGDQGACWRGQRASRPKFQPSPASGWLRFLRHVTSPGSQFLHLFSGRVGHDALSGSFCDHVPFPIWAMMTIEPLSWLFLLPFVFSVFIFLTLFADRAIFICRSLNTSLVFLCMCPNPHTHPCGKFPMGSAISPTHLIGKTVFLLSLHIPAHFQMGTSLIFSLGLSPGLDPGL